VHDLALLVIPGFALADLRSPGDLRWPRAAALVLVLAYAAINLTLALDLWSAAIGALAIRGVSHRGEDGGATGPYPTG